MDRTNKVNWTDDRIKQLTELWESGRTANQIAFLMGISRNSVIGKAHRLNLSKRKSPIKKKSLAVEIEKKKTQKHHMTVKKEIRDAERNRKSETCFGAKKDMKDLKPNECLWPIGDPRDDDFGFCGAKISHGSYCAEHASIAYQPPKKKETEE
jgi:GcrA cell cycle regulator